MAVATTTNFNHTRNDIIKDALLELGVIDAESDSVTVAQYNHGARVLNRMVKGWSTQYNLWRVEDVTVTLTPGTQSYEMGDGLTVDTPKPLKIISARRQNANGYEIPVNMVSRQEYMDLPIKSTQSPVVDVYYDPQRDKGVLYVWPTGSTGDTTLIVTVQRPFFDFDTASNNPDLPQEWLECIVCNLAVRLAASYQVDPRQSLVALSGQSLMSLIEHDAENASVYIQPDFRGYK